MLLKPVSFLKKAAAGAWTPTDLGAKLIFWADPTDLSTQWQDTSGSTAVTATGQTVNRIDDKTGSGRFMTSTGIGPGGPNLVISGSDYYWNFAEGEGWQVDSALPQTTTDAVWVNVLADAATFILFPVSTTAAFLGVGANGITSDWWSNAGTPTARIDGAAPAANNRDGIYDAVVTGGWVTFGAESCDFSTNSAWDTMRVASYPAAGGFPYSGLMGDILITTALTSGERSSLETWLNSRKP